MAADVAQEDVHPVLVSEAGAVEQQVREHGEYVPEDRIQHDQRGEAMPDQDVTRHRQQGKRRADKEMSEPVKAGLLVALAEVQDCLNRHGNERLNNESFAGHDAARSMVAISSQCRGMFGSSVEYRTRYPASTMA